MARRIKGKLLITGTLEAQTPISVGGAGSDTGTDLELAVNGKGEYYIPGSSLMGPLRAWIETNSKRGRDFAKALLGYQEAEDGHASYVFIEDAVIENVRTREVRDGIGIDLATGTTQKGFKYTRAIIPRGARIPFHLEVDLPTERVTSCAKGSFDDEDFRNGILATLSIIGESNLRLGAAKSRGMGVVKFTQGPTIQHFDFSSDNPSTRSDVMEKWLAHDKKHGDIPCVLLKPVLANDSNELEIKIAWKPASPLMVKAGRDGNLADMMPLVSAYKDGDVTPVIPGSSLKGILRSHATKICRTLTVHPTSFIPEHPDNIIGDLFGTAQCAGRVYIHDVYQKDNQIAVDNWLREERSTLDGATVHEDHVAIDRFTGGASDSALYSVRAPAREKAWEEITIRVDFSRPLVQDKKQRPEDHDDDSSNIPLSETHCKAEAVLLFLLIRDLQAGLIPIGFGTRRGMGEIEVTNVSISGRLGKDSFSVSDKDFLTRLDKSFLDALNEAWKSMTNANFQIRPESKNTEAIANA